MVGAAHLILTRFPTQQNGLRLDELERSHHALCLTFVLFEVGALYMCFVGGLISVRLENPDLIRMILDGRGIQRQDP
jgi:hypothetical protein